MADFEGYARKEAERARRRQEIKENEQRTRDAISAILNAPDYSPAKKATTGKPNYEFDDTKKDGRILKRTISSKPLDVTGKKGISGRKMTSGTISSKPMAKTGAQKKNTAQNNSPKMTAEAEENRRRAIAEAMKNVRRGP